MGSHGAISWRFTRLMVKGSVCVSPNGVNTHVGKMIGSVFTFSKFVGWVVADGMQCKVYWLTARKTNQLTPGGCLITGTLANGRIRRVDGAREMGDAYGVFIPTDLEDDLLKLAQEVGEEGNNDFEPTKPAIFSFSRDYGGSRYGEEFYITAFRESEAVELAYASRLRVTDVLKKARWQTNDCWESLAEHAHHQEESAD